MQTLFPGLPDRLETQREQTGGEGSVWTSQGYVEALEINTYK